VLDAIDEGDDNDGASNNAGGFRSEMGDNNSVESVENVPRYEESKGPNLSKTRIDNDHTVADNFNS